MLETAIVGGGLCGLALARHLQAQGREFGLFEARSRLGGRILSVPSPVAGIALDLGPSWIWPHTQPRVARLAADLGLNAFPQHDTGQVLNLTDYDKQPDVLNRPDLHGGAHRMEGGMGGLVQALVRNLPAESLRFEHVLTAVIDRGDHVALQFRCGAEQPEIHARRVVLAVPPRLLEEGVRFEPPLDGQIRDAMRETPTWMADQAKVMVGYRQPFWRARGHSGNAFVQHEHVVLGEIFDACDASGTRAALGGLLALPAELRRAMRDGMSLLISSQLVQVFGPEAETGEQHFQDWAAEPFTCSARDGIPPVSHPEYGHPGLRRPQWSGRLHFGGSETATYGGGYLEGALEAAARIQRALDQTAPIARPVRTGGALPGWSSIDRFSAWVSDERGRVFERYRRQLQPMMAGRRGGQMTQRAALAAMEQIYSEALALLDTLNFDVSEAEVVQGRAVVTHRLLSPFVGFNKALLDQVVAFNRSSCALSNFPDEHVIAPDYLEAIARDLAAAWQEFAVNANALVLAKAPAGPPFAAECGVDGAAGETRRRA